MKAEANAFRHSSMNAYHVKNKRSIAQAKRKPSMTLSLAIPTTHFNLASKPMPSLRNGQVPNPSFH